MALTSNNAEVKAITYGGVTVWEKIQKLATPTIAIDGRHAQNYGCRECAKI